MDYYIVINGQKQGPFDLLGFIKKVKNGVISAETLVSNTAEGPFIPANEMPEAKEILKTSEAIPKPVYEGNFPVNRIFTDAVELWTRKIVEYTMSVGIIIVLGILFSMMLKKIQIIADYSFVADYLSSVLIMTMLGVFTYFVLLTKRNQEVDKRDIGSLTKTVLPSLLTFALITSIGVVTFGISAFFAIITVVVMIILLTLIVFVPFIVTDHRVNLGRALRLSVGAFKPLGVTGTLAVGFLVGANIVAATLPALFGNDAAFIGLVVTLPLTISALAYIYDQVLA